MYNEQLSCFTFAYETGSFAEAARRTFMSSQGVAKAVHGLEKELDCVLFEGRGGRLVPTTFADEVYRFSSVFLGEYGKLQDKIETMKAAKERVFCVGVSLGVVGILGLDFFARFEDSHPGVAIRYEERPDILCDEGLRQGLYDFAFTVTPYDDAFQTRHLFSMGLSMWVNAANPLCAKGRVSIEDLASNVLAMPGCGFKNFHRVQSMCSARGVAPKRLFQSHQMYWIFNFVKEGGGIGTNVDTLLLEPEFQSDLVVSLPFEDFSYRFGLSWDRRRKLNDVEEGFLAYAASTCRALEERTSQGMRERERRMARR